MNKKSIIIFEAICLIVSICSCKQRPTSSSISHVDAPSPLFEGAAPKDTLINWEDLYPRDVRIVGRWLCVLMAKSDTCIYSYDKETGTFRHCMGILGEGPQDMMNPEFFRNSYHEKDEGLKLCDVNTRKSFSLTPDAQLTDFAPFQQVYSSVNSVANSVIGHPLEGKPAMWEMHDANGKTLRVGLEPSIPSSVPEKARTNLGYLYSCHVLAESHLRSVIVPMYFFDLIQVYDAQGNLLKLVSPQEGYDFEQNFQDLLQGNAYWGYPQCFCSERYCYLYRCLTDSRTRQIERSQLLRLDWEGNLIDTIELDRPLWGGFCVEHDTTAYCIVKDIHHDEEVFRLVRYTL